MGDGGYNVTTSATDILGNGGSAGVPVKLDRQAPQIEVAGPLVDGLNGFARDGAAVTITARDQFSGTRSLAVAIDGTAQGATQTCASDGCTLSRSLTIDAETLEEGQHTLTVTAIDGAGNTSTTTKTFKLDSQEPTVNVSGGEWESDGLMLQDDSGEVIVDADDAAATSDGVAVGGIRSIEVLVDGQRRAFEDRLSTCQTGACPATDHAELTVDNRELGDGSHTFTVVTRDAAGNEDRDEAIVELVHQTTRPAENLNLAQEPGLRVNGASGDRSGESVAQVDDVDGDGLDDYLVGSPAAGTSGAAHLVFGTGDEEQITLGGDSRDASGRLRSVQLTGAQASDRAGAAVATAGDVNGDGVPDLLIGAPGTVTPIAGVASGKVHVVFGSSDLRTGPAQRPLADLGAGGYTVRGPTHVVTDLSSIDLDTPVTFGAQLGTRQLGDFAVDGDVNGDGLDDVVIGDSTVGSGLLGLNVGAGVAYVIYGKADTGTVDLGTSSGDPGPRGYRIVGATLNGALGQGTAMVGDVNGDERGDVLVAAPGEQSPRGTAYLVFGRTGGDVDVSNLGSGGYKITGASGDRLATAASVGDVNGDGAPELLLGGRGAVMVYGKAASGPIDLAGSFDGYRMQPPADTAPYQQARVFGVGDMDNDDAPDALIGFPQAAEGAGEAYLVFGRPTPRTIQLGAMPGNEGTTLRGPANAAAGSSAAGTHNGPGTGPRVLVGTSGAGGAQFVRAAAAAVRRDIDVIGGQRCQGNGTPPAAANPRSGSWASQCLERAVRRVVGRRARSSTRRCSRAASTARRPRSWAPRSWAAPRGVATRASRSAVCES